MGIVVSDVLEILRTYGMQLLVGPFPKGPLGGLALTLLMAVAGLVCAFPLAVLIGIGRTSSLRLFAWPAATLVHSVRAVPVLMLLFWAYFILPLVTGETISGRTTLVWALVVYETAYIGEVVKAGILAIPRGEVEAARSLGLSYVRTMRHVVLPQALVNMIPSILNQFVSLIKNTSLGYIISVNELTFSAYQINNQLLTKPFQVYFILAMIYFLICFTLSSLVGRLERTIHHNRAAPSIAGGSSE
jgi:polar amino acid transport system permease protein